VRNCPDGSVAIEAEGPINQLNELRLWCERGPSGAQVLGVTSSLLSPCRDDWFEVRH
jgi:acylphosphatase